MIRRFHFQNMPLTLLHLVHMVQRPNDHTITSALGKRVSQFWKFGLNFTVCCKLLEWLPDSQNSQISWLWFFRLCFFGVFFPDSFCFLSIWPPSPAKSNVSSVAVEVIYKRKWFSSSTFKKKDVTFLKSFLRGNTCAPVKLAFIWKCDGLSVLCNPWIFPLSVWCSQASLHIPSCDSSCNSFELSSLRFQLQFSSAPPSFPSTPLLSSPLQYEPDASCQRWLTMLPCREKQEEEWRMRGTFSFPLSLDRLPSWLRVINPSAPFLLRSYTLPCLPYQFEIAF